MFIKRPGGKRKSYAIVGSDGRTIQDPRIDQINKDLYQGTPRDELEARIKAVLRSIRGDRALVLAPSNLKLVDKCHQQKMLDNPYLVNPDGLKRQLIRSVEALGHVSVQEASKTELLLALQHVTKPASRRDIIRSINELLRFAERPLRLPNPAPPRLEEIVYIRIADFIKKAPRLAPDYATYLGALFATGCRFAELPAAKLNLTEARITGQIRRNGVRGLTKNKRSRTSPVLPPLSMYVKEAMDLGQANLVKLRLEHYDKMYAACKKVFGIRIHDLRHSYAVEWGSVGASTAEIARYIGDTEKVCEDHYRNYCAAPDEIERALKRWG